MNGKHTLFRHLILSLIAVAFVIAIGEWLGPEVLKLEDWIQAQGPKGPLVFLILFIVLSSFFVPDTIFAVIAGTLFGIAWGTLFMFLGGVIGAILNFYLARKFFRRQVRGFLEKHPRFSVVEQAAEQEGLRLLLLLRLVPLNPATVSYLLGTTGVRFTPFLYASVGLIPGFFVEVYFGYLLKHVSTARASSAPLDAMHLTVTIIGFILCAGTLVYLVAIARRALAKLSTEQNKCG